MEKTQDLDQIITRHPEALLLLLPFIVIFLWAARKEFLRWWRHGASQNQRARFPIDEDAPSYEPPPPEPPKLTTPVDTAFWPVDDTGMSNREGPDMTDAKTQIEETINANDVVLYMKGTKEMPQCGFSSRVAGVLNFMGVEYSDVNVLADDAIRQGIKDFSDWPTIPQLYVKGEFVGGCDIITEMTLSGELDQLFEKQGVAYDKAAAEKIREANA